MGQSVKRGRYKGWTPHCPERRPQPLESWIQANSGAEPVLQRDAVAQRKHARRLVGGNLHTGEKHLIETLQAAGKLRQGGLVAHVETGANAAGARNADEIDAALRVAWLHPGLAIDAIVENDDRKILRFLDADG